MLTIENPQLSRVFCLPSKAGKPGLLKEADVAPTKGKTIRMARALLVTAGSEGSHRKLRVHSASEPDSAGWRRQACKKVRSPILGQLQQVMEGGILNRDLCINWGSPAERL